MNKILQLDDLIKDNNIIDDLSQPVFISEYLGVLRVPDKRFLEEKLALFQYYLNFGSYVYSVRDKKPDFLSWICSFDDMMDACEEADTENFEEAVIMSKNRISSGVTLGEMWINHERLGNQIMSMLNNFVFGANSFFCLSEVYHEYEENNKATCFKRKKCTLVTDFTHMYIENSRLHMNVSIRNCDIYDILECIAIRYFLSRFILLQDNFKSITSGNINLMVSNYIVPEEKNKIILNKSEVFFGNKKKNYGSRYLDGEACTMYDDYLKHKETIV